jgi:hypothetical protein
MRLGQDIGLFGPSKFALVLTYVERPRPVVGKHCKQGEKMHRKTTRADIPTNIRQGSRQWLAGASADIKARDMEPEGGCIEHYASDLLY